MVLTFLFFVFVGVFGRFCDDYTQVLDNALNLYDYVIVGGGGAGAVLANKLATSGSRTLLLEQGDDTPCSCDQQYPFQLDDSQPYIKPFFPTPQEFPVNRENPLYEFTGLGGSTRIYGATYTRASKDFLNSKFPAGYQFNDLLPSYIENEDHYCYYLPSSLTGISAADCTAWHGKNGSMQISPPTYNNIGQVAQHLLGTASFFPNIGTTNDYNGDPSTRAGLAYSQQFRSRANKTDANSARQTESTYSAFLPASFRTAHPNLVIETSARVVDILVQQFAFLSKNVNRTRGVEYLSNGKTLKQAWAKQAVFVAAGVMGSPKLLQLSGIGPASLLSSMGIPVVANNSAIGTNLRAHQAFFQAFKLNQSVPLTSYWNAVQGRFKSGYSALNDIQLELLEGVVTPYINVEISGPSLEMAKPQPWKIFQFVVSSMDSAVQGSVQIQSKNPLVDPRIDLGWTASNFLQTIQFPNGTIQQVPQRDLIALYSAMAQVRALVNVALASEAPQALEIQDYIDFINEIEPGLPADALDFAAFQMYLRYSLTHIYHVTSSVSLGTATDLTGAVNGVKGLYVCDNSLLPAAPDGNPTATMIAVCSKIAKAVLQLPKVTSLSNSNSVTTNSASTANSGSTSNSVSNSGSGSSNNGSTWWQV